MLTVKQVAQTLNKSPRWVQLQIKKGLIRAEERIATRKYYLIEESELERLRINHCGCSKEECCRFCMPLVPHRKTS